MSTTTKNYQLVKPELTDAADITAMNENWDRIDEGMNTVWTTVSGHTNELKKTIPVDRGGTNATNPADACANLGAATVLAGEVIPSGADLNTYTTPGSYRSHNGANSASLLNTPYNVTGFKLEVFNTTTVDQIMQEIKCNAGSARTYRRIGNKAGGVVEFGDWHKVMQSTNDELGIVDGGTGANNAKDARINLGITLANIGAAPASHKHATTDIASTTTEKLTAAMELGLMSTLNVAGSNFDIGANDDLNYYTAPGVYRVSSANIAKTIDHAPPFTTAGYRLEVKHTTTDYGRMQVATFNQSAPPLIYVRVRPANEGADWGNWYKLNFTE